MMDSTRFFTVGVGVGPIRLTGHDNFVKWKRDFQLVAEFDGVWDVIIGKEKNLPKPIQTDYFTSNNFIEEEDGDAAILGRTIDEDPTSNKLSDDSPHMREYEHDFNKWESNQNLLRRAKSLLAYWVDPSIQGKIRTSSSASEAYDWVKSQYKISSARALDLALSRMKRFNLELHKSIKSIGDFLLVHEMNRIDIEEAGGDYSLIRPFIDQHCSLMDMEAMRKIDAKSLINKFLAFESEVGEMNDQKLLHLATKQHLKRDLAADALSIDATHSATSQNDAGSLIQK